MSLLDADVFGPERRRHAQALPRFLIRNAKQKATDMKGQRLFKPVVQHPETFTYSPPEETFYELMSEFILAGKAYATSLSRTEGASDACAHCASEARFEFHCGGCRRAAERGSNVSGRRPQVQVRACSH
jgi:hypothetical protein